jgi:hypothetical protein
VITDPAERSRLLTQLQRQLRERLAPAVQALLDELEERLFDLAERSRVGTQQHVFFDGLRECRRKRTDVQHDFLEAVQSSLRTATAGGTDRNTTALGLVANDELEETLTLSAMADRIANRHASAIDALDRRIAMLQNQARVAGEPLRLSPQQLGLMFRHACQCLDVGIEVRLVAYSLFGHHVLDALDGIYLELNRELIAAGVLPAIALSPTTTGPSSAARSALARREYRREEPVEDRTRSGPAREAGQAEVEASFHDVLRELRRAPADPIAAANDSTLAPDNARAELSSNQLLDALDRLVHFSDDPRQLKRELLAASGKASTTSHTVLSGRDEDTVDVVGLVFDAVRRDPYLPARMQPLIARLQVPFLRAALFDPRLMEAQDHPARRLVDEMGELALGWTASSDPDGQLVMRMSQIIESLLQPQETGPEAFERAIAELNQYLDISRHRADLAEQRAVEAALGRERLRIARSRVAAMLERRLSRYTPLPWVRQLLRGPWANYLVLLWLRQGENGDSFRQAFVFVDELLWCDEHGQGTEDEARLQADRDELEDDLRYGLSTVAYHDREVERLASELRQFISALMYRTPAPGFLYESDPKLGAADFSQSWSEPELEDQPEPDRVDASLVARLRSLPPGTWFEFNARQGERAKLSWSSPFSGRCLFVNRNGLRVDEIAPERLAREIERGLTRILESTRLLQRSIQSLLDQMRANTGPGQQSA